MREHRGVRRGSAQQGLAQQTDAGLREAVHQILDRHGLRYELAWHLSGAPFLTVGGRLVEVVQQVLKAQLDVAPELSTGGGTSDGRFIAPLGVEVVELGPNNASIHKIDECVDVAELEDLARVYQGILGGLLTA